MSAWASESILPVEESVAHKADVLAWDEMTNERCDLQFRGSFHLTPGALFAIGIQLATVLASVSLAAWVLSRVMAVWTAPLQQHTTIALLMAAAGIGWAVVAAARRWVRPQQQTEPLVDPAIFGRALLPSILWQAIVLTARLDWLGVTFAYYLFVSVPLAVFVFDRFATHAVCWITASPMSGHTTMTLGRPVWAWRLFGLPHRPAQEGTQHEWGELGALVDGTIRAARSYRWGCVWVAAATAVPAAFVAVACRGSRPTITGLLLAVGIEASLLAAVVLRSGGDGRIAGRFFQMLIHWFYYGRTDRLPSWVFRSPCGGWAQRQLLMLLVVGLLALPLTSLAAHSFRRLPEVATTRGVSSYSDQPSVEHDIDDPSSLLPSVVGAVSSWLWIAPTAVVALTVGPLSFCLIGIFLTGNLISSYQDIFESLHGPAAQSMLSNNGSDEPTVDEL